MPYAKKPMVQHRLKKGKSVEDIIRGRQSYAYWKGVSAQVKQLKSPAEVLEYVFTKLDDNRAFGSQTNSDYNRQALNLVEHEEGMR